MATVAKGDKQAAAAPLGADFTWTDAEGATRECRTVPYTPKTEMDKAILAAWQTIKMTEWKPDAEAWARASSPTSS